MKNSVLVFIHLGIRGTNKPIHTDSVSCPALLFQKTCLYKLFRFVSPFYVIKEATAAMTPPLRTPLKNRGKVINIPDKSTN